MSRQQQQEQSSSGELDGDSIPALRIFKWDRTQLAKADELFEKRKSELIKATAERLESKGFPTNKICTEIVKQLADYVDDKYVRELLSAKYKDKAHSDNALSRTENRAKSTVREMLIEEYELAELQSYPKDYLIEIIKW